MDNFKLPMNLGDLSKPAVALIEKASEAVGGLFLPWQTRRVAKANADAALIKEQSKVEITDLHRQAMWRRLEEEVQHQQNMENILKKAVIQLSEDADPSSIEKDWLVNFFFKSRIVSDDEMQELWARILAGEANTPGTYSKRTVNLLEDLDKIDAQFFMNLCRFVWKLPSFYPVILNRDLEIYKNHGINFECLTHLESIGLIKSDLGMFGTGYSSILPKHLIASYYGRQLVLEMPNNTDNRLAIGKVIFTRVAQELAPICLSTPVEGFYEYVKDQWKEYLPKSDME